MYRIIVLLFIVLILSGCQSAENQDAQAEHDQETPFRLGAERFDTYIPLLRDKSVGMVVNHTSLIGDTHLVDTLLSQDISIVKIFSPEHGFRGTADAGEHVENMIDRQTGIPLVSLYGEKRKPGPDDLEGLDIVIFDIQDVGVRFYTYISTMHLVMEACAELGIPVLVLDRPNPNGNHVDGPVRIDSLKSFVGMHPVPVLHGVTVAELAKMINGEAWLEGGINCDLTVVPMQGYSRTDAYSLPVKPSPNLPNDLSVQLYPSLCLFEGTKMSVGRGTTFPFQVVGYPDPVYGEFTFTPESIEGMAKNPKYKDQECHGKDYRSEPVTGFSLQPVIDFYQRAPEKGDFFNSYFPKLAGNFELQGQIEGGMSEAEIRETWQEDLDNYKKIRSKYLLYP